MYLSPRFQVCLPATAGKCHQLTEFHSLPTRLDSGRGPEVHDLFNGTVQLCGFGSAPSESAAGWNFRWPKELLGGSSLSRYGALGPAKHDALPTRAETNSPMAAYRR
jgi:hypothetical protein